MQKDKTNYIEEGVMPLTASQIFRQEIDALVPNPVKIELSPVKELPDFFNPVKNTFKAQP